MEPNEEFDNVPDGEDHLRDTHNVHNIGLYLDPPWNVLDLRYLNEFLHEIDADVETYRHREEEA